MWLRLPSLRGWLLPLLAVAALSFAIFNVLRAQQTPPPVKPPITPAETPFSNTLAGAGLVEAQTENISIGTPLSGIVVDVFVKVGQKVNAGAPLFRLDDRQLKADLQYREAALAAAEAQLQRLVEMPRQEEVPPSEAKVLEAKANLAEQEDQVARGRKLRAQNVLTQEELVTREQAYEAALAQFKQAQAQHALLLAGAWSADKAVSRAAVEQARAQIGQTRTDLERLTVRALVAGQVLQVNVRPGEFVATPNSQALIVLGNVQQLHVRVDIDEHDIPRFRRNAPAVAQVRGNQGHNYRLTFVRVEPYVIPKRSLTGDNTERVDTRVLQVIYALDSEGDSIYVGQQVDVFIDLSQ
jgi:multidrug resistance efflux pump